MTLKDLKLLRGVLNDSLDALERAYKEREMDFPSIDEPYIGKSAEENLSFHPEVRKSIDLVIAASYQLLCTVRDPFLSLADASNAFHISSCLRVAEKFNISEVLKDSAANGLHVDAIAAIVGVESSKLARILRVLATHHIYREVEPNVFANNRISSYFCTDKTFNTLSARPKSKYESSDHAACAASYIGTCTDDIFKASSYLLEELEDKETGQKSLTNKTAFQKALRTEKDYFSWLESQENDYRLHRFGACIRGSSLWDSVEGILDAFDWKSIGDSKGVLVDVGGGMGGPSMMLAHAYPDLRVVIEDRPEVVARGIEHWKKCSPDALNMGRVSYQVQDFFETQTVHGASAYLLRAVCHNWPDDLVLKILKNLRLAANASTRLILADYIIPYACPSKPLLASKTGNLGNGDTVPSPLLLNLGKSSFNAYYVDMTMQVVLNGQERTLNNQTELAAEAGWKVIQVNRVHNSHFGYIVAEPTYFALSQA